MKIVNPSCPGCGSNDKTLLFKTWDHEYETTDISFPMNTCVACGLVYLSPRPDVSALNLIYPPEYMNFNTDAASKVTVVRKFSNWLQSRRIKKLINGLYPGRSDLKVLDVGCGDGYLLDRIKDVFPAFKTFGVEPYEAAASVAGKKHDVFVGIIEDFRTEEKYDLVVSYHVIEHVAEPRVFLENMKKFVKEDGYVIIDTPNLDSCSYKVFGSNWGGIHAPRHWTLFSLRTFSDLAQKVGFNHIEVADQPISLFWIWSTHSWLFHHNLKKLADRYFHPVKCLTENSWYYFGLFVVCEFFERGLGLFMNRSQMRAILSPTSRN